MRYFIFKVLEHKDIGMRNEIFHFQSSRAHRHWNEKLDISFDVFEHIDTKMSN